MQALRVHPVDVADEGRLEDVVAEQLLDALRVAASSLGRDGQRHVLDLTDPRFAVLRCDREPRPRAAVRAAAMHEGAGEEHRRAGLHQHLDGARVVGRGLLVGPPEVGARDHLGGPVALREVVEGPDGADAHHAPRARHPYVGVVEVPALSGLAGMDLDREARRQAVVGRQQLVEEREHDGMLDDARHRRRLGEQRVDALGMEALEVVAPHQLAAQPGRKGRLDLADIALRDQVRGDHIAVPPDRVCQLGRRVHRRAGYRESARDARGNSVAAQRDPLDQRPVDPLRLAAGRARHPFAQRGGCALVV